MNGEPAVYELRVHGVGGSPGPRLLGFESRSDVVVVGEGVAGTEVLARRSEPGVEGYCWGDLTSGTGLRALWIILLPFTLLNVAGWMHPPPSDRFHSWRVAWIRGLVHILSVLLTATYMFSFGIILVDVAGWQWSRRVALSKAQSALLVPPSKLHVQRIGVILGLIALGALMVFVMVLAGKSQVGFEKPQDSKKRPRDAPANAPWGHYERLDGSGFFDHQGSARRLLNVHRAVLVLTFLLVAGWSWRQAYRAHPGPTDPLGLGDLLGVCSGVAIIVIVVLLILSWTYSREDGEQGVPCAPAIAATLSFGLVNAVFSGAILLLFKRLHDWPKRSELLMGFRPGPEVNLVDVWGLVILVLGAAAVGVGWWASSRPPAPDVKPRESDPGHPLDGADMEYRKSIAKSRILAQLAHHSGAIALGVAVALIVTDVAFVVYRVAANQNHNFYFLPPPPSTPKGLDAILYRVGIYVLPALVLLFVQIVRKSEAGARTFASTLWDVLTFWPRRFSPLAVRPYSERAVPELQGRILYHVREHLRPVVLSAHSQGSILAFAAVAPLADKDIKLVALVTYGCPVATIYATFFPAYFGAAPVEVLRAKLPPPGADLLGWRNFFRATDPIGGPIMAALTKPNPNCELADPFSGSQSESNPVTTPPPAPLEHDRPMWSQLAVHSYYLQEPDLKEWVRDVKIALARTTPPEP